MKPLLRWSNGLPLTMPTLSFLGAGSIASALVWLRLFLQAGGDLPATPLCLIECVHFLATALCLQTALATRAPKTAPAPVRDIALHHRHRFTAPVSGAPIGIAVVRSPRYGTGHHPWFGALKASREAWLERQGRVGSVILA
jgi:hypothetical protein